VTVKHVTAVTVTALLLLSMMAGCGVKAEYLPQVDFPYLSEMEFLKEVKNVNGKAKKRRFKGDKVRSPFYFFFKVKEIENSGTITVRFYKGESSENLKTMERTFQFGEEGKYYEYVIFFDRVKVPTPGKYRYAVFYNNRLIYEDQLEVSD
jgi:hypothetical protein